MIYKEVTVAANEALVSLLKTLDASCKAGVSADDLNCLVNAIQTVMCLAEIKQEEK
jgi:hypothetical protein